MSRTQMAFRSGESHFQSRPLEAKTVAEAGSVGILDTCARSRRAHPRQRRDLERREKRRGLQLAGRRAGPRARYFEGRICARLRREHFPRAAHGFSFSRRKTSVHRRRGDAKEFYRIWPPNGTTGQRIEALNRSEEHTSELQSRQYLVCRL